MHIPPYYKKRTWQIFLIGVFAGSIVAYIIFTFMYGKMYANILTDYIELQDQYGELERQNETLLRDKEQLQIEKEFTIQSIHIHYVNGKQFRFDRLTTHQLNSLIKEELKDVIGKDVKSIADNSELIRSIIEKYDFTIKEINYSFEIKKMVISEQLQLDLHVKFAT